MNQDTICALATANGIGAIGIIRVSGEQAIEICENALMEKHLPNRNLIRYIMVSSKMEMKSSMK